MNVAQKRVIIGDSIFYSDYILFNIEMQIFSTGPYSVQEWPHY